MEHHELDDDPDNAALVELRQLRSHLDGLVVLWRKHAASDSRLGADRKRFLRERAGALAQFVADSRERVR